MSQVSGAGSSSSADQTFGAHSSLNDLDLDAFLDLMLAELQNQDPLNPLENDELLAQISQIREVGATDKLTETLESVLLGQNISSATNLIGADVVAMTDAGERVTGNVRRVSIDGGQPSLDVAVNPVASPADFAGNMEEGVYKYDVVWQGEDGKDYSFPISVDTAHMENFNGAIELRNIPNSPTNTQPFRIYRSDSSGGTGRKYIGQLQPGNTTKFTDVTPDAGRGATLTTEHEPIGIARRVTVTLNNVAQIEPPPQQ